MRRPIITLILSVSMVFASSCSAPKEDIAANPPALTEQTEVEAPLVEIELTLEELAAFNGQNGQPAYVAHKGVIYDLSAVTKWATGEHNGIKAGTDITGIIENAPHGVANLKLAKVVGKIVE